MAFANKVKIGLAFLKLGIYHGVYFDCIKIIDLRGYIDLLDTCVIVFVNNLGVVCVSFFVICIVELLVFNVIIIFIFILNYVLIVKLGIFIYYKI